LQGLKEAPIGTSFNCETVLDELPVWVMWMKEKRGSNNNTFYTVSVYTNWADAYAYEVDEGTVEEAWASYTELMKSVWMPTGELVSRSKAALTNALADATDEIIGTPAPTPLCIICYGHVFTATPGGFCVTDVEVTHKLYCPMCVGKQHVCWKCTRMWVAKCDKGRTQLICPSCRGRAFMKKVTDPPSHEI
jgi:hypothetical protein